MLECSEKACTGCIASSGHAKLYLNWTATGSLMPHEEDLAGAVGIRYVSCSRSCLLSGCTSCCHFPTHTRMPKVVILILVSPVSQLYHAAASGRASNRMLDWRYPAHDLEPTVTRHRWIAGSEAGAPEPWSSVYSGVSAGDAVGPNGLLLIDGLRCSVKISEAHDIIKADGARYFARRQSLARAP